MLQPSATAATQTRFYLNRYTLGIANQTMIAEVAARVAALLKHLPPLFIAVSISYKKVAEVAAKYIVMIKNRYIPLYSVSPNSERFHLQPCNHYPATAYNRFGARSSSCRG